MAVGWTQPLPGGGKERPAHKADNLTAICEPIMQKMWEPRRLTTCYRNSFTFFIAVQNVTGKKSYKTLVTKVGCTPQGGESLEVSSSKRTVHIFSIEVTSDKTLGN
jgi:hypothetical protein